MCALTWCVDAHFWTSENLPTFSTLFFLGRIFSVRPSLPILLNWALAHVQAKVLSHHPDLLRQRAPTHRPCLYDHRGRRHRAPAPAARRRHLFPDRDRRAWAEGRALRGRGRAVAPAVRRSGLGLLQGS